ncbi:MAG: quinate 5-dehydrogenase, partial [Anaerolineae bacterium]|nr:quinate 5-dehydrogenase [Anaerolineae bacterium]
MKKVLSISVGSSTRDHTTEAEFLGEHFWLSRQGTDGDFERYIQMYREYDGKVDAFGVGGAEFYLLVNNRRYYFREAKRIRRAVKISKIADGNGIKHLLAPRAIQALREHGIELRGKKALKTTGVDRYGMAKVLVGAGCDVTFGDFMFALDLPIPIRSLRTLHILAAVLLPCLTLLPFRWLYPLGEEQEKEPSKKYSRFYEEADVIAGDFLQVWSYLPDDLSGKIIITN